MTRMKLRDVREALSRKLPDWLDRPLEGCCVVNAALTLILALVWLGGMLLKWLR
jgi:uncharacterized RDD family membrane protein YckC